MTRTLNFAVAGSILAFYVILLASTMRQCAESRGYRIIPRKQPVTALPTEHP